MVWVTKNNMALFGWHLLFDTEPHVLKKSYNLPLFAQMGRLGSKDSEESKEEEN